jgi:hypothetical protein
MKHLGPFLVAICSASACSEADFTSEDITSTEMDEAQELDSAFSFPEREIVPRDVGGGGFAGFSLDNPCEDPPVSCQDIALREATDARVNVVITRHAATGRLLDTEVAVRGDSQFAQSISYESSMLNGRITEIPGPTFPIDELRCELASRGQLEVFEDTYHIEMNRGTTYQAQDGYIQFNGPIRAIPASGDAPQFRCASRVATLSAPGAYNRTITLTPRLESVTLDPSNPNTLRAHCTFSMPANEYYVTLQVSAADYTRVEGNVFHAENDQLKNIMCLSNETCTDAGGIHAKCGADRCCAHTPF